MRFRTFFLIAAVAVAPLAEAQRLQYPASKKGDVVEDYHGTSIPDPYRWMENLGSTETVAWIRAQNAVTNGYLEKLPYRETLRKRITELWDYPKVSLPYREGGRLFYRKNSGLQKQSVLYVRDPALLKACAGADCTLWFLDRTKAHRRMFCSATACGNRAKVAAFRRRAQRATTE